MEKVFLCLRELHLAHLAGVGRSTALSDIELSASVLLRGLVPWNMPFSGR
jgi:hypothetical protein